MNDGAELIDGEKDGVVVIEGFALGFVERDGSVEVEG